VGSVVRVFLSSDVFYRPGHLLFENSELDKLSSMRPVFIARL
jgi:hypothetical protein